MVLNILSKLKTKDRLETLENYSLFTIFLGGGILSLGIGLTVFSTQGISAVMAMLGALVAFLATVILILVWLIKEFRSE